MEGTLSCFLMYLGLNKKCSNLEVHNIIFDSDFNKNINDIFSGELSEDPSIYLYVPSKLDNSLAPEGKDGLYVLVPVPELSKGTINWDKDNINKYREKILGIVKRQDGLEDVEEIIEFEEIITPLDFKEKFNAYNGATFGLAPTLFQSNYYRPQNKYPYCEGLYFTGSSVHPGAGVPIVLTSGKITAEELMKDDNFNLSGALQVGKDLTGL
jgi:phytoene desaturase